ncbi:MAG: ABC transporter substrate-binding protein [Fusobacteriaceae bacterium]
MKKTLLILSLITGFAVQASTLEEIKTKAKQEGEVISVGMPDNWANWKDTWVQLEQKFGLKHSDTDMSSAQEIAKFKSEGKNATTDIGDIGAGFASIAVREGVTQAYKTSYWNEIPDWAKDKDGHWMLAYTGTIAFIIDKDKVAEKDIPRSWAELKNSKLKVSPGDVGAAAQASSSILAAAYALGGDEKNIEPAIKYFTDIAKEGRLSAASPNIQSLERGEIEVGLIWDFNGLSYRDVIDSKRFEVLIPSDGTLISGYTTIINKWAKNPNAAKLTREYILSDEGQLNLAKGNARPIRNIELPQEIKNKMIPDDQYKNARPIKNQEIWDKTSKALARIWQEEVLVNRK